MSILPGWRWWAGWAAAGSAGVLAHQGYWRSAAALGVVVVVLVARRARDLLAAGRAEAIRESLEVMAPEPLIPAPRREPHPPWDTAAWPAIPAEAACGDAAGRHRKRRGPIDVVADALRAVAQAYLS